MALERDSIEKKDFPTGRRGYDPAAVDAHLAKIADEVETLKQGAERSTQPVATAISEQVRGVVEAAEKGAAEIRARAEQEARELREEALRVAERARLEATEGAEHERAQAAGQAREHVGRVSESTSKMLERLQTIDGELTALTASLRAGVERVKGELERLEEELGELSAAAAGQASFEEEARGVEGVDTPVAAAATEPELFEVAGDAEPVGTAPVRGEPGLAAAADEPVPAADSANVGDRPADDGAQPEPIPVTPKPVEASEPEPAGEPTKRDDSEGARLIALNMALNGTPREETDRYLAENFSLQNRESLLDEVYARVQG